MLSAIKLGRFWLPFQVCLISAAERGELNIVGIKGESMVNYDKVDMWLKVV
jgi:hypothetical protein